MLCSSFIIRFSSLMFTSKASMMILCLHVIFSLDSAAVVWHLAKMRNTVNNLCLLYKVFKTNVMCGTRMPKSIRTARKKESRVYDELLQIKWPKEVNPLPYFLIELIQNPNFLPYYNFRIKFSATQQHYFFSVCARFHFC